MIILVHSSLKYQRIYKYCIINFIRAAKTNASSTENKDNDDENSGVVRKKKSSGTGSNDDNNDNSINDKLNGISETAVKSKVELHRKQD